MMTLLPAIAVFEPSGFFTWIVIGLVAGAIASRLVRGKGMGCLGDIVVGILGSFVGAFVLSLMHFNGALDFVATIVVATLGAVILLALIRLISRG